MNGRRRQHSPWSVPVTLVREELDDRSAVRWQAKARHAIRAR